MDLSSPAARKTLAARRANMLPPPGIRLPPAAAGGSRVPSSPTDSVMSPVSKAIGRHRHAHGGSSLRKPLLPLILGSSSPARAWVLAAHGVEFSVAKPGIDEKTVRHPDPTLLPLLVARAKAAALRAGLRRDCILITADQVVLGPEGDIREKPEDKAQAAAFIRSYSGRCAQTVSAVVVVNTHTGEAAEGVDVATVYYSKLSEEDVAAALEPAPGTAMGEWAPLAGGKSGSHSIVSSGGAGAARAAASSSSSAAAVSTATVPASGTPGGMLPPEADVMLCAGAVCFEHPAIAPHIVAVDGALDSVYGLPWEMTVRLINQVTAAAAAPNIGAVAPHGAPRMAPVAAARARSASMGLAQGVAGGSSAGRGIGTGGAGGSGGASGISGSSFMHTVTLPEGACASGRPPALAAAAGVAGSVAAESGGSTSGKDAVATAKAADGTPASCSGALAAHNVSSSASGQGATAPAPGPTILSPGATRKALLGRSNSDVGVVHETAALAGLSLGSAGSAAPGSRRE